MVVTSSSSGIPTSPATTVSSINAHDGHAVGQPRRATQTNKPLTFSLAGNTTSGSTTISTLKGTTASLNSIVVGMGICGTGIPANAYVTGTTGSPPTSLTMSAAATSTKTGDIVTLTNLGATTTTGSTTVSNVSFSTVPSVGQVIIGNGIPANTTITAVAEHGSSIRGRHRHADDLPKRHEAEQFLQFDGHDVQHHAGYIHAATYDSAYNTASPAGSSTTTNWGGCVIEPPPARARMPSGTGVLSFSGNPDHIRADERDELVSILLGEG